MYTVTILETYSNTELYTHNELDRLHQFMKFWKMFRPFSVISIMYYDEDGNSKLLYNGLAKDYRIENT